MISIGKLFTKLFSNKQKIKVENIHTCNCLEEKKFNVEIKTPNIKIIRKEIICKACIRKEADAGNFVIF